MAREGAPAIRKPDTAGDHTARRMRQLRTITIRKVLPEPTPAIRKPRGPVLTVSGTARLGQHG